MNDCKNKYKANQDIRDYMADRGVTQKALAAEVGLTQLQMSRKLQTELSQKDKEMYLNMIDSIVSERNAKLDDAPAEEPDPAEEDAPDDEPGDEPLPNNDVAVSTKFQIGDRVKIPSKSLIIGTVSDIWSSFAKQSVMYAVDTEDGRCGLYAENQLEPAPLPIDYSFEAIIDGNVAVVTMIATQGEKTWVYARGHAHILHDGEVGMAQAVSYASKRMFESLDTKQESRIYFKDRGNK